MQDFVEERFPEDISFGSSGGPEYFTDVIETINGREIRNVNWSRARARYNVAHGVRNNQQLETLIAFFRARHGRAVGFRFKDWADYKVENELLGMGDEHRQTYQLYKYYHSGQSCKSREITKPVQGTLSIRCDGAIIDPQDYKCCYSTGIIEFINTPKGGKLTVDFEFDVPVRFDIDYLNTTFESYGIASCTDIRLVEIKI